MHSLFGATCECPRCRRDRFEHRVSLFVVFLLAVVAGFLWVVWP